MRGFENSETTGVFSCETHRVFGCMQETFQEYSRLIMNGARPSDGYWDFQEYKLSRLKKRADD